MSADPTRDPEMTALVAAVFDSSATPMLIVDDGSICLEVNQAACDVAQSTRAEIVGSSLDEVSRRAGTRLVASTTSDLAPDRHLVVMVPLAPALDGDGASTRREPLSGREKEVLALLAAGDTNGEVAESLGISSETVRNHTRNARRKLGARSRSHAIAIAITVGQLELDTD